MDNPGVSRGKGKGNRFEWKFKPCNKPTTIIPYKLDHTLSSMNKDHGIIQTSDTLLHPIVMLICSFDSACTI